MTRRAWLAASLAAGVLSVTIAVTGGFVASVGGVRVSAHSWYPSAAIALLACGAWAWSAARSGTLRADLEGLDDVLEARGRTLVPVLACLTIGATLHWATYSASGADASGYLSQATMWSHLATRVQDPLVTLPDWPLAAGSTAPLGWRPALERGWQVPTYAPGLPWLMAVPHAAAGTAGAVLVVALTAGIAVWATGALAWRLGGGVAALLASLLVVTSPTFLYQAFQPMSDVPVTAAWVTCWWLVATGAPGGAGVAAALAVLVRPNLAPLAAVPWAVIVWSGPQAARRGRAVRFAIPVALAGLAVALVQWQWYGSPFTSGYGTAGDLFTLANLVPNVRLYAGWLWEAEGVIVITASLGVVSWGQAPNPPERRSSCEVSRNCRELGTDGAWPRALVVGMLLFAGGVTLAYLVYAVFEVWSYVRFLLPALAVVAASSGAAIAHGLCALPRAARGAVATALLLAVWAGGLQTARSLGVFQVAAVTARARDVGTQLRRVLPPNAVLLAGEQSGSMRYATDRPIVRWEPLDPASLRATLSVLEAHGFDTWWVLDQFEEAGVRARFAGMPEAALDWAPLGEGGPIMRTRAWRLADRPRSPASAR